MEAINEHRIDHHSKPSYIKIRMKALGQSKHFKAKPDLKSVTVSSRKSTNAELGMGKGPAVLEA